MGRVSQTEIFSLASLLLATATLSACDAETRDIQYDGKDRGLSMAEPKKAEREKCYGVARAQYNDCAAGPTTDCAGTATQDRMPDRWIYVANGRCANLGGSLTPGEPLPNE